MAIDSKWNRLQFGEYSISIDAMKQKYGADIFERYVQSYNIPQPKKKTKQISKTLTKNTKRGIKRVPINTVVFVKFQDGFVYCSGAIIPWQARARVALAQLRTCCVYF